MRNFAVLAGGKTKPIQSQFKQKQSQNKPNSKPIFFSSSTCARGWQRTEFSQQNGRIVWKTVHFADKWDIFRNFRF